MAKYYRMVIDLYKSVIADIRNGKELDQDKILGTKKALACAITEAKIKDEPYTELLALQNDLRAL